MNFTIQEYSTRIQKVKNKMTDEGLDILIISDPSNMNTHAKKDGSDWIINDTYPDDQRKQYVYLYHVPTNRSVPLGRFYAPPEYQRQLRIDTHPRISPDGRKIVIDSAHTGEGRQMHIIDIGEILDG